MIVQFVETMNGIRAVQAFRRERRNASIMDGLSGEFADAETEAFISSPGSPRSCGWSVLSAS